MQQQPTIAHMVESQLVLDTSCNFDSTVSTVSPRCPQESLKSFQPGQVSNQKVDASSFLFAMNTTTRLAVDILLADSSRECES